jgi:hypothetical protein
MEARGERLDRIRSAFRAGWGLLCAGEFDRVVHAFDPDVAYVDHRAGGVRPLHGHDELRSLWATVFAPGGDVTLEAEVVDMPAPDQVLTLESYTAGTEQSVAHGLYRIRFGRISRAEFFATEQAAREAAAGVAAGATEPAAG